MSLQKVLASSMVDPAQTPVHDAPEEQSSPSTEAEDVVPEGADEGLDDDLESFDEGAFDPMQHLTQLFVTESGVPLVDVAQGIQDAIAELGEKFEKHNRILYKLVSVIESKAGK